MGISTITKMVCDHKGCNKTFLVDDAPNAKLPPGTDEIIRTIDALGNKQVFCTRLHMVADAVAYIKATPQQQDGKRAPATENGRFVGKHGSNQLKPSSKQIKVLEDAGVIESRAGAAVEELETLPQGVPPAPENLELKEPDEF
jgi:hypothetical protein